jgi:hypothetical protein
LIWRAKPRGLIKRPLAILALTFIENGIAYTTKQVSFLIACSTKVTRFKQLHKYVMNSVLRPAAFSGDRERKQQEGSAVLPIEQLNFGNALLRSLHNAASIVRQPSAPDLFNAA